VHVAIDARLADYRIGGIAQYTIQLARALAGLEAPERFTLLRSARPKMAADTVDGVAAARLLTPPHHPLEQLALPVELLRVRPDVLHSPDFIPPLRRSCRSVITVHDLGFLHYPCTLTGASRRYYSQIGRAVRSADRIIAVSECTRDDLLKLVQADPDKIDVVLEAADPSFTPVESEAALAAARRRLGVERPYLLFVGSFEPRKNLVRLLEAFARVRRELDVQLVLVGRRGWLDEPIFRRLAELDLESQVRVVDAIPNAEMPPVYGAAALLAFPSLYEGFGLPPLEAMACGCPVVASDRASLPEVIGDAGLLVPAEDVDALAEAMLKVLSDAALRAQLVQRGLARARRFSWDRAASESLAIYRRAAG
jgi:glycosyltransferase involved in cell wall biosynthesis